MKFFLPAFFFAVVFTACSPDPETGNETVSSDSISDSVALIPAAGDSSSNNQITKAGTADAKGIAFGFSNSTGDMFLMLADTLVPGAQFSVVTADGRLTKASFIKKRFATAADDGRQTEYNFDNSGGYLFGLSGAAVNVENSVVFLSPEFLEGKTYFSVKESGAGLPAPLKAKIEADKKRAIKKFRCLAEIDKGRGVYLFEFELKKDSALAALAYVTPGKIVYENFPAKYDELSTWRVDDGGEFVLDDFNLLAVFEKDGKMELVTDWAGAEGYSVSYLKETDGYFKVVKKGYRYCAPL